MSPEYPQTQGGAVNAREGYMRALWAEFWAVGIVILVLWDYALWRPVVEEWLK